MNIFEKAFNRSRTFNIRKRTFSNLSTGINANYLNFYVAAINDYNNRNLNSAFEKIKIIIKESDIDDWKHYAFKANILEDWGQYSEAIVEYERAIEYCEKDVNVYALYHQIGFCYLSISNDLKAVEFYSYAIALKNDHPNSEYDPDNEGMDMGVLLGVSFKRMYNNRANALMNIGRLNESLDDCKRSLSFDKYYSNPYLLLYQIYSKAGQIDQSMEFLKISAELGNKNAISTLKKLGFE